MEQAEESVPLQDFVFPSKTLLLLGKEREGVPVELLNQVSELRFVATVTTGGRVKFVSGV